MQTLQQILDHESSNYEALAGALNTVDEENRSELIVKISRAKARMEDAQAEVLLNPEV